uniref:Uncharacterized protein n=1 Tax=Caenorhabditis japonica TaxID=281687 RepID=A0A8R1DJJ7_CAEJA
MLTTKMSPNDPRPATPSGELKMLKDMLDNEKHKNQKLQFEFQKDTQKNMEHHRREIENCNSMLREKEKEIEILKANLACQKPTLSVSPFPKQPPRSPMVAGFPSTSYAEVKKVYPKILLANQQKTPHRHVQLPGSALSAFRHATKAEEDDTFQLDASFEPSATSTPKLGVNIRTGIRRPLNLDASPFAEAQRGEPTPKRKPVFKEERKKRSRVEVQEEIRKIWETMDGATSTYEKLFAEKKTKEVPCEKMEEEVEEEEEDDMEWIDRHLQRRMKNLELRKQDRSRTNTAKSRAKILQQAEHCSLPDTSCSNCRLDERIQRKKKEEKESEKEWEEMETQRANMTRRGADELRTKQYSEMFYSVNRKGLEGLESLGHRRQLIENQYVEKTSRIQRRTLDEVKEEKKAKWREGMMEELRNSGEMDAELEIRDDGRNEDYIWTSESDDEDWQFPPPYNHNKRTLCKDCLHQQRRQRRITKRERERRKLKTDCLNEFGVEQREQLRDVSILTKSKMEAAENELNRHVVEVLAGSRFLDEDEEDIF